MIKQLDHAGVEVKVLAFVGASTPHQHKHHLVGDVDKTFHDMAMGPAVLVDKERMEQGNVYD